MTKRQWNLIELWGDTADTRHLAWSIVIGATFSLSSYLLARSTLRPMVADAALSSAYAMLAGLGGSIAAGVLCGWLFPPKRQVLEEVEAGSPWQQEVLAEMARDEGGLGLVRDLPPAVASEMRELKIYDLFAAGESRPELAQGALKSARGGSHHG